MTQPLRVLVVGAGAVGQVFGRHLQRGGADVAFLVREKYRDAAARGFDMYVLNGRRRTEPVRFDGFSLVTRAEEVAAQRFDQVYLTVSSPALAGAWLGQLLAATGDATIVALQPGIDDRDRLITAGASEDRLVSGMISLLSYAAPLPGETRFLRPGTAYWFPPLAPSPFSGPSERTAAVVAALRAGKLPARRHGNVPRAAAFPTAVLMPYLVALEAAGWSFRALGRGDAIQRGARGARAALAVVAASEGRIPLSARMLARPGLLRLGLWLGRRAMPLPLEVYVKEHFTKVHDQTIDFMTGYLAKGRRAGVNVTALDELLAGIAPRPASERESTASAVQRS